MNSVACVKRSAALPTLAEIDAEIARRSLAEFVRQAWDILEPETPLFWNWHIDVICQHLEAVADGRIRRLLINVPPGHMKSLIVSVFWPAWMWAKRPGWRGLFSSYAMELAIRDSVRCRDLITSEWYQQAFAPSWKLKGDQNVKSYFENDARGFRFSMSVGGRATGFRGDCMVVDDPLNAKEQYSDAARAECVLWWDQVMSSRLNDQRTGARVIIMQRLHEEDLSGHVLAKGGYQHLCLPSEFDPERRSVTCIGWADPRRGEGELLFPDLFPAEVLAEAKRDLGSAGFAGQHQQRPAPAEGIILKRHWWCFWQYPGQDLPPIAVKQPDGTIKQVTAHPLPPLDERIQSWDMTFKDTKGSDFVCGQVWGKASADRYLLDQVRERLSFTSTLKAVKDLTQQHPLAVAKLVEDKANGSAVIDTLQHDIPGLIPVEPQGGKQARAHAASPLVEAGNVYLPHPAIAPWVFGLIEEAAAFPNGANDDQVDAFTQAQTYWQQPPSNPLAGILVQGSAKGWSPVL